jgi:hypothetical protein
LQPLLLLPSMSPASIMSPPPTPVAFPVPVLVMPVLVLADPPTALVVPVAVVVPRPPTPNGFDPGEAEQATAAPTAATSAASHTVGDVKRERLRR